MVGLLLSTRVWSASIDDNDDDNDDGVDHDDDDEISCDVNGNLPPTTPLPTYPSIYLLTVLFLYLPTLMPIYRLV